MATTFDLVQEDFAEITLSKDEAAFKVRLLKRKDKAALLELKKKADSDSRDDLEKIDIIDIMQPYVEEDRGEAFKKVGEDLTFAQLKRLQEVWFEMNGMKMPESKASETAEA